MIYKIQKRTIFGGGSMESYYEVMSYERRTQIGILVGGQVLYSCKTKREAIQFCRENNIEINNEE